MAIIRTMLPGSLKSRSLTTELQKNRKMGYSRPFAEKVTLAPMKDGAVLGETCRVACRSTMPCMMAMWTNQADHDSLLWGQEMALPWVTGSQISVDRSAPGNQEELSNTSECKEGDRNNEITREEMHMANKYTNACSISPVCTKVTE